MQFRQQEVKVTDYLELEGSIKRIKCSPEARLQISSLDFPLCIQLFVKLLYAGNS